jgi:hypothetical protein
MRLAGFGCLTVLWVACIPCTPERCCQRPRPAVVAATEPVAPTIRETYQAMADENLCPEGVPFLQDTWRFVGKSRTPEFTDVLAIRGTRFVEQLSGRPDGGEVLHATLEGEVRCLEGNRVLVRVETVKPPGAFGNREGDTYPCDVLNEVSGRSRRMLLLCFFDWDLQPAAGLEFEYERVVEP